jgi:hypothetical protein
MSLDPPDRSENKDAPISAVVITAGQSVHLATTLASLAWCDEVLVLVSHDADAVRRLPLPCRCRIATHPFDGYGRQKRRAVSMAAHDWVLSLDDDEWLDEAAIQAIQRQRLATGSASYAFPRRTFIGNQEIKHGPWGGETVTRLFDRRRCVFADLAVHEAVRSPETPTLLTGSILHHSFATCADVLARSIRYAQPKASIIQEKQEPAHTWMLPLRGLAAFLKSYIFQAGYRDGAAGFTIALSRVIDSTLPRILVLSGHAVRDRPTQPANAICHDNGNDSLDRSSRPQ